MDRTSPVSRAFRLALALAFIYCLLVLPGSAAQAGPGPDEAPAKVRDGARALTRASQAAPQAQIAADGANAPCAIATQTQSQPQRLKRVYLPIITAADCYSDWVSLGQPAGQTVEVAVNYLYTSQSCPFGLPSVILAGTDKGLYKYGISTSTWTAGSAFGSVNNVDVQVSQVFSTTQGGLFVSSYNQGLWNSLNGGNTWSPVTIPNNDSWVYGLAQTDQYLYAAGRQGLYRRDNTGVAWSQIQSGVIYTVAAAGNKVYAVLVGAKNTKDTLLISNDGGNTWPITRKLPGALLYIQSLDADPASGQVLIGAVDGGLFTLDGANNIVPFSQGLSQTVFGTWRDAQQRAYTAADIGGGLRRFPQSGGASNLDLSALPVLGSLTEQALFTINGSTVCNILAVGSESGGVWMRRVP
jgi:hypothetical protein